MSWEPPNLTLRWGAYFKPDPEDEQKLVKVCADAKDAGFITLRTGVEKLSRTFGIENVDSYLEKLDEEAQKRAEEALKTAQATAALAQPGTKPSPTQPAAPNQPPKVTP